jgi:hypothetical protein
VGLPQQSLSHVQYLELQELATRVLLELDATTCGGAVELRTLRKRLVRSAIAQLDAIQAAYSRAVNISMQRDDEPPRSRVQPVQSLPPQPATFTEQLLPCVEAVQPDGGPGEHVVDPQDLVQEQACLGEWQAAQQEPGQPVQEGQQKQWQPKEQWRQEVQQQRDQEQGDAWVRVRLVLPGSVCEIGVQTD